jgi:hypothetical protein
MRLRQKAGRGPAPAPYVYLSSPYWPKAAPACFIVEVDAPVISCPWKNPTLSWFGPSTAICACLVRGDPMILARFLFPHQVARRLYAMGWRRKDMPTKIMFNDLCGALRASGYDADRAANLWNKCLQYDREAIEQLKRDSGLYGILHLTQFFNESGEPSKQPQSRKRKTTTKSKKPNK